MPGAIFIRVEDGLKGVSKGTKVKAFPLITNAEQIREQMIALVKEDHDYKTLVIDSVTAMDRLFIEDILSKEKVGRGLQQACGGYGAGFDVLASRHQMVRKAAEVLRQRRGMNVVFLAHVDTVRMTPPDSEQYMSYSLRMHPKGVPNYTDDVDLVGFLRLETHIMGGDGERKKALSDGTRELICLADAASVSKNRYGITEPLIVEWGKNPFEGIIPSLSGGSILPPAPTAKKKPPAKAAEPKKDAEE
jgi:hypothetical protein